MSVNIAEIVASRLEDMAEQVNQLFLAGEIELATVLRTEGLELARAYDEGYEFFYINDLKHVR